jgi:hypothetical protein
LTIALLGGAVRLTRAVANPDALSPGFSTKNLQVLSLRLPGKFTGERAKAFTATLNDALKHSDLPSAALSYVEPFDTKNYVMFARRPDEPLTTIHDPLERPVTRNYFSILGIPIIKGRIFGRDDDPHEIVLSESAARMLWPDGDAVGKTLLSGLRPEKSEICEVVGIAKDVPVQSMSTAGPVVYRALTLTIARFILVRSDMPDLTDRVRAIAAQVEGAQIVSARPYASYLAEAVSVAVVATQVAWVVGSLGLALALVGAFAVFAYAVESRRREIGIRLALGAGAPQVVRLLFAVAAQALGWGALAGFALTIIATPALRQLLFGLSSVDLVAFGEVIAILAAATALATWIPARRAVRVDPVASLRQE